VSGPAPPPPRPRGRRTAARRAAARAGSPCPPAIALDPPDTRRIRELCRWWDRHARDLPWRRRRDGYTALVAEAMLQQTQVSRVVGAFDAFLARFPTIRHLAAADEQMVLAAWDGLGYYRRARHLHRAARTVVEEFGGIVPRDAADLRRLPGVGRYTAGAIASLVYGRPEPILDGNVQRVLARWHCDDAAPQSAAARRRAWARSAALAASAPRPAALNEALMELGATICTPRAPRCEACPVAALCLARRRGRTAAIPPPRIRGRRTTVHHHAVIMERRGRVLLERRGERGLWAGLWQPPTIEGPAHLAAPDLATALAAAGLKVTGLRHVSSFTHLTTHRHVLVHVHVAATRIRRGSWLGRDELLRVAMSSAHRRALAVATPRAASPRRPPRPRRARSLGS
jgi:A/G-specific adenine glycosylase